MESLYHTPDIDRMLYVNDTLKMPEEKRCFTEDLLGGSVPTKII